MRIRLTLITGISLLLIICHLVLVWTGSAQFAAPRSFLFIVGILGWLIGNKLIELEERLGDIDKAMLRTAGPPPLTSDSRLP